MADEDDGGDDYEQSGNYGLYSNHTTIQLDQDDALQQWFDRESSQEYSFFLFYENVGVSQSHTTLFHDANFAARVTRRLRTFLFFYLFLFFEHALTLSSRLWFFACTASSLTVLAKDTCLKTQTRAKKAWHELINKYTLWKMWPKIGENQTIKKT